MAESAVWYLVVQTLAATIAPFPTTAPMVGPITETQCEQTRASLTLLPDVVSARCKRVVGGRLCQIDGSHAMVCPIFEGDLSAPVGSPR